MLGYLRASMTIVVIGAPLPGFDQGLVTAKGGVWLGYFSDSPTERIGTSNVTPLPLCISCFHTAPKSMLVTVPFLFALGSSVSSAKRTQSSRGAFVHMLIPTR